MNVPLARDMWNALIRDRTVTVVAIASLAISIGLTTGMFAILDAISHPVVPYRDPDRVFSVLLRAPGGDGVPAGSELAELVRERARSVAGVTTRASLLAPVMTVGDRARAVRGFRVGHEYFDVLGIPLAIGRAFDERSADERVAIITEATWTALGGRSKRLGEIQVVVDDTAYTIIGVVPQAAADAMSTDVWLPSAPRRGVEREFSSVIVRLRSDVAAGDARREIELLARSLARGAASRAALVAQLISARPDPVRARDYHYALVGAAACVLLIACANIATLLLARGVHRRHELAIRSALGASRTRLVMTLLVEHTLIAVVGGVLGVALGLAAVDVAMRAIPDSLRSALIMPHVSWRVFAFGLAICSVTVLLVGLWPAIRAAAIDPSDALKEGTAALTSRTGRGHQVLVAMELGLAAVLLVASGLLARTVYNTATFDFGYTMDGLVSTQVVPVNLASRMARARADRDAAAVDAVRREAGELTRIALRSLERAPDIAASTTLLTRAVPGRSISLAGAASVTLPTYHLVSPSFFRTFQIPITEGSDFPATLTGETLGIVDERLARRLSPTASVIGRTIVLGQPSATAVRIVGVTKSAFLRLPADMNADAEPLLAVMNDSSDRTGGAFLVARVRGHPSNAVARATTALRATLPAAALTSIVPWSDSFRQVLDRQEFLGMLFVAFAGVGLLLAAIGLYGSASYMVEQRARELAVRVALGASRRDVLRVVYRHVAVTVLAGMGAGVLAAMWTSRLLDSILFGVYRIDPVIILATDTLLVLIALVACWRPAYRAMRSDPLSVIRAA